MRGDKASKRSTPRPDHDPPKHLKAASNARRVHCYRGPKWRALSKPEASQSSLSHSIREIQRRIEFASPHIRDRHDHSWRKINKFICVLDLDKLVQEARMSHHDRLRDITIVASNSPFSEGILEYEFPKKFMILTFDCYSSQSDLVQYLRQY